MPPCPKATTITSIEETAIPECVYDITVEGTHNFFCDNHLVRNCDEAHLAGNALESHLAVSLSKDEIESAGCHFPDNGLPKWDDWRKWAKAQMPKVSERTVELKANLSDLRDNREEVPSSLRRAFRQSASLERKLKAVDESFGDWVWEKRTYAGHRGTQLISWKMTPVWIASYTHPRLFRTVPKVIAMSAVLTEKATRVLGIPQDKMDFLELPSYFPKKNAPVYHVPTVRMNYDTTDEELRSWVNRIDQIISKRLDRKGILFTVSYKRRDYVLEHSRYRDLMITHRSNDVIAQVVKFKRAPAPKVLVSPAVTTGYDFPGRQCSYTIIGKLPYPNTKDPVMQARQEIDPTWSSWLAMDTLVQECGRGFRFPDDILETIIVDDSISWYWKRYKDFAPEWFQERYLGRIAVIPEPPNLNGDKSGGGDTD